jgi:hypothetical protein
MIVGPITPVQVANGFSNPAQAVFNGITMANTAIGLLHPAAPLDLPRLQLLLQHLHQGQHQHQLQDPVD